MRKIVLYSAEVAKHGMRSCIFVIVVVNYGIFACAQNQRTCIEIEQLKRMQSKSGAMTLQNEEMVEY